MKNKLSLMFLPMLFLCFGFTKQNTGINIGNTAPEIIQHDPNGKTLKLSSLRGKYVVLDFWASWCPPCRRANPGLVRIYKEFNEKNFDNGKGLAVFSVSLDKDKSQWIAAIKADQLEWQEHVSDLMGWNSQVAYAYHVESIPSNFILDGNGKIVAKNREESSLRKFLTSKEK